MNDCDHPLLAPLLTAFGDLDRACSRLGLDRARVRGVQGFVSGTIPTELSVALLRLVGVEGAAKARDAYLLAYTSRSHQKAPRA